MDPTFTECVTDYSLLVPQINSSRDTATRLLRLAYLPRSSHEDNGIARMATPLPIYLRNLSFAYPSRPSQLVLNNVSLEITAHSSIAIVGASGSGKSTIASLLLGLYPLSSTSLNTVPPPVTYNGVSSRDVHIHWLRSQIAVVPQTPVLFPTTIAGNIAYGFPEGGESAAAIAQAAKRAGIHDFIISLPRSYGTVIGDGGQDLSGGQAQRIAIARALVRKPKLLILDEATSALDAENARIVCDTVQRLIRRRHSSRAMSSIKEEKNIDDDEGEHEDEGMAVLIITHAKEMMQVAERIVVLDQGRVAESGTWDELMSSKRSNGGELKRLLSGGEWQGPSGSDDGGQTRFGEVVWGS